MGVQKLLGQKQYDRLEAVCNQSIAYYDSKRAKLQAYYDARVDKNSPYYKPIVRLWRIAGKTVLYVLVYLFVIETNIFWLTDRKSVV